MGQRLVVVALGLASLLMAAPGMAQAPSGMALLRKAEANVSKPALVERYGADPLQFGELRLPPGRGPFPVAVVIHGGCWTRSYEGLKGVGPLADSLTRRGIATWNIEYRAAGDKGAGYPGTFQDVAAGVDHVRKLARRYPLDLRRGALVGHSAGAHLALWAASRPRLGKPWSKVAWRPAAVAAIDGPATLSRFVGIDKEVCGQPVIVPFMGGTPSEKPDAYRLASPQEHVPLGLRTLLVKGSLGFAVEQYEVAAKAAGDPIMSLSTDPQSHFDMITPGTPNGEKTADWLAANLFPAQSARRSTKK